MKFNKGLKIGVKEIRMFYPENTLAEKEIEILKLKGEYLELKKWRNKNGNFKK